MTTKKNNETINCEQKILKFTLNKNNKKKYKTNSEQKANEPKIEKFAYGKTMKNIVSSVRFKNYVDINYTAGFACPLKEKELNENNKKVLRV